ncbi:hypothetical protein [Modicisalibacter coralii]|uniref:hypothetical protein n=1 Tax=Modicisalibacter coralii TaxID=2304602 RepID=UPI00100AC20F|nr:hypothetical protein [Halomonas coralii]
MVSEPAARRLARARDAILNSVQRDGVTDVEIGAAMWEFDEAANALADDLIADNHHLTEGD